MAIWTWLRYVEEIRRNCWNWIGSYQSYSNQNDEKTTAHGIQVQVLLPAHACLYEIRGILISEIHSVRWPSWSILTEQPFAHTLLIGWSPSSDSAKLYSSASRDLDGDLSGCFTLPWWWLTTYLRNSFKQTFAVRNCQPPYFSRGTLALRGFLPFNGVTIFKCLCLWGSK